MEVLNFLNLLRTIMDYLSIVYDRKLKPKTSYPSLLAREVFRRFNLKKGSSFLEIGCGNGDLTSLWGQMNKFNSNLVLVTWW